MPIFTASKFRGLLALISALAIFVFSIYQPTQVRGLELLQRSVDIADAQTSVTTTHSFAFNIGSGSAVGSIEFEYCSNDPFPGQPCIPPSGLDV